jgi:hypothetical protein
MSGNLFDQVLEDVQGVEERLLGPTYSYADNIKTPSKIGMSSKGSMKALGKNIDGLIEYVELMVTGKSKASATGGPLGNKFFLQTGAKCQNGENGEQVDRHIYINNVPNGNIPFISSGMGVNFSEFRGLIPGAMGNLNVLNPFGLMRAFLSGPTPECQPLTMETIDVNNNKSSETHYITLADIKGMDSCSFSDGVNPISKKKCKETFTGNGAPVQINDIPSKAFMIGVAGLYVYIFYRIMQKTKVK